MVRKPGLPGRIEENLPGDVVKLRIVDADDSPGFLDEALAHINTGVRDDSRQLVEGITEVLQQSSPLWFWLTELSEWELNYLASNVNLFHFRSLNGFIFQFLKFEEEDEEKYCEDVGQVHGILYLKL